MLPFYSGLAFHLLERVHTLFVLIGFSAHFDIDEWGISNPILRTYRQFWREIESGRLGLKRVTATA
jgi:hypothetical protein